MELWTLCASDGTARFPAVQTAFQEGQGMLLLLVVRPQPRPTLAPLPRTVQVPVSVPIWLSLSSHFSDLGRQLCGQPEPRLPCSPRADMCLGDTLSTPALPCLLANMHALVASFLCVTIGQTQAPSSNPGTRGPLLAEAYALAPQRGVTGSPHKPADFSWSA